MLPISKQDIHRLLLIEKKQFRYFMVLLLSVYLRSVSPKLPFNFPRGPPWTLSV